jgi:hypothetical protein
MRCYFPTSTSTRENLHCDGRDRGDFCNFSHPCYALNSFTVAGLKDYLLPVIRRGDAGLSCSLARMHSELSQGRATHRRRWASLALTSLGSQAGAAPEDIIVLRHCVDRIDEVWNHARLEHVA